MDAKPKHERSELTAEQRAAVDAAVRHVLASPPRLPAGKTKRAPARILAAGRGRD